MQLSVLGEQMLPSETFRGHVPHTHRVTQDFLDYVERPELLANGVMMGYHLPEFLNTCTEMWLDLG